jgi:prolyl-tRNA synthetase
MQGGIVLWYSVPRMKYSKLFGKTNKMTPADADSANARLLLQGGFVDQLAAGIYTYLPLGLKVLEKIKNIVREEMNELGAQEVLMPALHPKSLYDATGRWDSIGVMFKLEGSGGKEFGLSSTAEEVITPLVKAHTTSYRDFPLALYQIQDKFRNEPRAKSGVLRGREFSMKDLYSFHLDEKDFLDFYERAKVAYLNVYRRCGLDAIIVKASGGVFTTKNSHEFQVPTEAGEDLIYIDKKTGEAMNKEIVPEADLDNTKKYEIKKAIEVGNIFPLESRFSNAVDMKVVGEDGKPRDIIMGCYGIGPSRVLGSIVEVHHDERGIVWPKNIAPALVHIVSLKSKDEATQKKIEKVSADIHDALEKLVVDVLWDERDGISAGEKFADADLIGAPLRLVVSEKTLKEDSVEWKLRASDDSRLVKLNDVIEEIQTYANE